MELYSGDGPWGLSGGGGGGALVRVHAGEGKERWGAKEKL
jgi:hypothetical protein